MTQKGNESNKKGQIDTKCYSLSLKCNKKNRYMLLLLIDLMVLLLFGFMYRVQIEGAHLLPIKVDTHFFKVENSLKEE